MTSPEWFAGIGGERIGPLTADELLQRRRQGEIRDDTLVWTDGWADWRPFAAAGLSSDQAGATPSVSGVLPALGIGDGELVRCAVSGDYRPPAEMLQYGDAWVAPEHKDAFLQLLREGRQPLSLASGGYFYRDPGTLAKVTNWLLIAGTIIGGIVTIIAVIFGWISPDWETESDPGVTTLSATSTCFYLLLFLAGVVSFCLWTYRVAANVRAFGSWWVRASPGWAVGWHFVPIACLWMPFLAMADVARASHSPDAGDAESIPGFVWSWWVLWVLGNIISLASGLLEATEWRVATLSLTIGYIPISIVSTWTACRLVARITADQKRQAGQGSATAP